MSSTIKVNNIQPTSGDDVNVSGNLKITTAAGKEIDFSGDGVQNLSASFAVSASLAIAANVSDKSTCADKINIQHTQSSDTTTYIPIVQDLSFGCQFLRINAPLEYNAVTNTLQATSSHATHAATASQTCTPVFYPNPHGTGSVSLGSSNVYDFTNSTASLNYGINVVGSSSLDNYCFITPPPKIGKKFTIINNTFTTIFVFPSGSNTAGSNPPSINGISQPFSVLPTGIPYEFTCWENPAPGGWSVSWTSNPNNTIYQQHDITNPILATGSAYQVQANTAGYQHAEMYFLGFNPNYNFQSPHFSPRPWVTGSAHRWDPNGTNDKFHGGPYPITHDLGSVDSAMYGTTTTAGQEKCSMRFFPQSDQWKHLLDLYFYTNLFMGRVMGGCKIRSKAGFYFEIPSNSFGNPQSIGLTNTNTTTQQLSNNDIASWTAQHPGSFYPYIGQGDIQTEVLSTQPTSNFGVPSTTGLGWSGTVYPVNNNFSFTQQGTGVGQKLVDAANSAGGFSVQGNQTAFMRFNMQNNSFATNQTQTHTWNNYIGRFDVGQIPMYQMDGNGFENWTAQQALQWGMVTQAEYDTWYASWTPGQPTYGVGGGWLDVLQVDVIFNKSIEMAPYITHFWGPISSTLPAPYNDYDQYNKFTNFTYATNIRVKLF